MSRRSLALLLGSVGMLAVMVAACGDDDDDGPGPSPTETATAPADAGNNDDPAVDVRGDNAIAMSADNFSFSPSLLRGDPGQALTISVQNDSGTPHNFTVEALGVDVDIPAGETADIVVTFPDTGSLVFVCTFHTAQGMEGELLAGDAEAGAAAPNPAPEPDYAY